MRALETRIAITENGRQRKVSKLDILITQLVNKAAGGDLRAIETVLRLNRDIGTRAEPHEQARPLSAADRMVLERFAERLRENKEPAA